VEMENHTETILYALDQAWNCDARTYKEIRQINSYNLKRSHC
jgi:hypothetical protein